MTVLSGGERRRLALALVVASGANFLVLDEPTNHLDVESREALEAALEAFPGTVLLVTHDRALLDAVSGRVLAIEDGRARRLRGRLGRVPAAATRGRAAAAEAEGGEAEAGAPEARAPAGADVARARRARGRPRRGARRRARAAARGGLDERRPRRGAPRGPRRPRGAARPLGGAVRGGAGLDARGRSHASLQTWPSGHGPNGRSGYPPPAPMRSSLIAKPSRVCDGSAPTSHRFVHSVPAETVAPSGASPRLTTTVGREPVRPAVAAADDDAEAAGLCGSASEACDAAVEPAAGDRPPREVLALVALERRPRRPGRPRRRRRGDGAAAPAHAHLRRDRDVDVRARARPSRAR